MAPIKTLIVMGFFSRPIFAFAEKNPKPRIFVYMYPSMKRLCECDKGADHAYVATTFAGDFLISLDSLRDFKLTVWLWRTGTKMASIETDIYDAEDYGQKLISNFFLPPFIAQVIIPCIQSPKY